MRKSEKYLEVTKALFKVQGAIDSVDKNASNPHFKSTYTDLAGLWKAVKGPLQAAGLLVVQTPGSEPDGTVVMTTTIIHVESGEWIESELRVKPDRAGPQPMGSVITYLKRYTLQSLLAVPSEDDDGNAATTAKAPTRQETARAVNEKATAPKTGFTKDTIFVFADKEHEKNAMEWLKSKNVAEQHWGAIGVELDGKPFAQIGVVARSIIERAEA